LRWADTKTNNRTASEFKIKRAQASSTTTDPTASRALTPGFGAPELNMSSGTADEAADRALTAVARKLDRALSTEYTVNDLIAEATDAANLACMFIGGCQRDLFKDADVDDVVFLTCTRRLEPASVGRWRLRLWKYIFFFRLTRPHFKTFVLFSITYGLDCPEPRHYCRIKIHSCKDVPYTFE